MTRLNAVLNRDFNRMEVGWATIEGDEGKDIVFREGHTGYVDRDPDGNGTVFYPHGVIGSFCFGVEYLDYDCLYSKVVNDDCWIAPDGTCYPCHLNIPEDMLSTAYMGMGHQPSAYRIIRVLYGFDPLNILDKYQYPAVQEWLRQRGWIRADINMILPGEVVTAEQVATLKEILKTKHWFEGVNLEHAREIIRSFEEPNWRKQYPIALNPRGIGKRNKP